MLMQRFSKQMQPNQQDDARISRRHGHDDLAATRSAQSVSHRLIDERFWQFRSTVTNEDLCEKTSQTCKIEGSETILPAVLVTVGLRS